MAALEILTKLIAYHIGHQPMRQHSIVIIIFVFLRGDQDIYCMYQ